ncbi:hypothetical protein MYU51_011279 [Penicillium brevicompactum]|uniref:Concanavalin A-like lectin/glucanases superfamily n=1 Tax=Penicillium brevicompactum TaxID=5074 RepID=A0A9W9R2X4_PENBR|nr:Concanavalin A-like lectin/glucanases superfamily [Penicillium brevicompactum]
MKYFATVIGVLLFSASVLAAPLTAQRQALHARRQANRALGRGSSRPLKPGTAEVLYVNGTTNEEYSSNWAGAVLIGNGYNHVTGEITVPVPRPPSGADDTTSYCASAWVGIDGDTCNTAILQTGVDICVQGGVVSSSAWYEWFPDYAHDFTDIKISTGDVVKITVDATSLSSGTAIIENRSTGKTVTEQFPHAIGANLCEFNAEWIVEDFSVNGGLAPFCNFGTVVFTDAVASAGGNLFGPSRGVVMEIYQDKILTTSSVTENSLTVSYL